MQNFAIYLLFCFAHYDNFSKWYIFLLQDKLNFFVLHNFKKWFSKTTVNQIVNDNWLVFWVCYFGSTKKWCLQNLCLIKKWMIVDIVDKNVFEIISLSNNLALTCRFTTIILCSVHSIWFLKYIFSAKIWFVKTSTRIVIYESRVVKSNPVLMDFMFLMFVQQ